MNNSENNPLGALLCNSCHIFDSRGPVRTQNIDVACARNIEGTIGIGVYGQLQGHVGNSAATEQALWNGLFYPGNRERLSADGELYATNGKAMRHEAAALVAALKPIAQVEV
tara:strand:+ start:108805 stop:109140 length:336 start_codon:yes stop_codon:yes gene_type:complete